MWTSCLTTIERVSRARPCSCALPRWQRRHHPRRWLLLDLGGSGFVVDRFGVSRRDVGDHVQGRVAERFDE